MANADVQIRRANREDLAPINALLQGAGLPSLPSGLSLKNILVATEDGGLLGAVALEVHGLLGLVRSTVVAPDHARHGVGTSLIQALVARAHELSLRDLYLLTVDTVPFFERAGFESVSRDRVPAGIRSTKLYREHCPESAAVMRLPLATRRL